VRRPARSAAACRISQARQTGPGRAANRRAARRTAEIGGVFDAPGSRSPCGDGGPGTTKTYVSRILSKLDLRDRAQAVVAAYENGLVTPGGR
jgi:hypothetical protein